ncbi:hypothetical protein Bca52824_096467 [Brassica carinata]|uniref:Uncharacterized protein n=1 Tax=Brassica carinata TaxID=52824 RepID=A0A8X7NZX6_BRACI|nr:hypothetical protein Bca52824_096467 [Brassica carinata]
MWSTGLSKEHFDGVSVGRQNPSSDNAVSDSGDVMSKLGPREVAMVNEMNEYDDMIKEIEKDNRHSRVFVDGIKQKMMEMSVLLKQVKEPGARGSYLKDSEKTEMYRLHKENRGLYPCSRHSLSEDEEEEERSLVVPWMIPLSVCLMSTLSKFFVSHDREFHVASLSYKPDFKVMPEGWDGTIKDMDEVHYEIERDDILLKNFSGGEVKCHKYSRRRSSDGWKITVEKLGPQGKRGNGGGWKFVSLPDGSSRPLNEVENVC